MKKIPNLSQDFESLFLEKEMRAVLLKCTYEFSRNAPEKKFSALYRQFYEKVPQYENFERSRKKVAFVKSSYLQAMSSISSDLVISEDNPPLQEFASKLGKDKEKIQQFQAMFRNVQITSKDDVRQFFERKSIEDLFDVYNELEANELFHLSELCYKMMEDFSVDEPIELIVKVIQSHTKSIVNGSLKAMKMFPKLMTLMESVCSPQTSEILDARILDAFENEMAKVPSFCLIPWCNQLLGKDNLK